MWSFYYNLEVSRRDFPAHFFEFLQKKLNFDVAQKKHTWLTSETRFGQSLPVWQHLTIFGCKNLHSYLLFVTISNLLWLNCWANLHCWYWPKLNQSSGHLGHNAFNTCQEKKTNFCKAKISPFSCAKEFEQIKNKKRRRL